MLDEAFGFGFGKAAMCVESFVFIKTQVRAHLKMTFRSGTANYFEARTQLPPGLSLQKGVRGRLITLYTVRVFAVGTPRTFACGRCV